VPAKIFATFTHAAFQQKYPDAQSLCVVQVVLHALVLALHP